MQPPVEQLLTQYESGRMSRRELLAALALLTAAAASRIDLSGDLEA